MGYQLVRTPLISYLMDVENLMPDPGTWLNLASRPSQEMEYHCDMERRELVAGEQLIIREELVENQGERLTCFPGMRNSQLLGKPVTPRLT